jgi:hypothetical protein
VSAIPSEAVQRILSGLKRMQANGGGWEALCPAHDDNRRSLSVAVGREGCALIKCHAGCSVDAILDKLGLTKRDLFDKLSQPTIRNAAASRPRIVSVYPYHDEAGKLLFEVVRYDPKDFRQRRPDGHGSYAYDLKGVRRVLFRLPQVLAAKERGDTIFVFEGEKAVEAAERLGVVATCSPGGAVKWRPEYSELLRGAPKVAIVGDNDPPGQDHIQQVEAALRGVVGSIVVIDRLPGVPP